MGGVGGEKEGEGSRNGFGCLVLTPLCVLIQHWGCVSGVRSRQGNRGSEGFGRELLEVKMRGVVLPRACRQALNWSLETSA